MLGFNLYVLFSTNNHSIPVVVTLITDKGKGDYKLLTGIMDKLDSISQKLHVQLSITSVKRFGKMTKLLKLLSLFIFHRWMPIKLYYHSFFFWQSKPYHNNGVA